MDRLGRAIEDLAPTGGRRHGRARGRRSAPIVEALADATERVTGLRPRLGSFPGATEAHVLARLGIPTVPAFGPGLLAAAHVPGESVAVADIRDAVAIYARVAAGVLG